VDDGTGVIKRSSTPLPACCCGGDQRAVGGSSARRQSVTTQGNVINAITTYATTEELAGQSLGYVSGSAEPAEQVLYLRVQALVYR